MQIPAKFVQQYIPREHLNNRRAIVLGPLGKVFPIELEISWPAVFFTSGWSQFLAFHGITKVNTLLLRYEGNMVFTVKAFGPDGCQRVSKHKNCIMQQTGQDISTQKHQENPSASTSSRTCMSKNNCPDIERSNRPNGSTTSLKKRSKMDCVYDIGSPAWLKKKINTRIIKNHHLSLPRAFCDAIGFRESCMITLQDPMDSTRSWQVHGLGCCRLASGWRNFCLDTGLNDGDVVTIKVVETALWHVAITRG